MASSTPIGQFNIKYSYHVTRRAGFEPADDFRHHDLSRVAPSASRTSPQIIPPSENQRIPFNFLFSLLLLKGFLRPDSFLPS